MSKKQNSRNFTESTLSKSDGSNAQGAVIPTSFDDRLLVCSRDAARLLSISERTLWSLVNRGEIMCIRIGTCKRYSLSALEAFIASRSSLDTVHSPRPQGYDSLTLDGIKTTSEIKEELR